MRVNLDTIMLLKTQKQLEDKRRLGNKEPNYDPVTLTWPRPLRLCLWGALIGIYLHRLGVDLAVTIHAC